MTPLQATHCYVVSAYQSPKTYTHLHTSVFQYWTVNFNTFQILATSQAISPTVTTSVRNVGEVCGRAVSPADGGCKVRWICHNGPQGKPQLWTLNCPLDNGAAVLHVGLLSRNIAVAYFDLQSIIQDFYVTFSPNMVNN